MWDQEKENTESIQNFKARAVFFHLLKKKSWKHTFIKYYSMTRDIDIGLFIEENVFWQEN